MRRTRKLRAVLVYGVCNFSRARLYDNISLVLTDLQTLALQIEKARKVRSSTPPYETTWADVVLHGIAAGIRYAIDTEGSLYLLRSDRTLRPLPPGDVRLLPWYFFVRLQRQLRRSPKLHTARAHRAASRHTPLPARRPDLL